ncbi:MAG: hypothetical protein RL839_05520 [Gammaproteobacteria bacterium]
MNLGTGVRKFWLFGPVAGLLVAFVVTAIFTTLDVVRNYGEVFRDASGIRWLLVYETAASWFLPTFLYVLVVASAGHLLFTGLSVIYKRYLSVK